MERNVTDRMGQSQRRGARARTHTFTVRSTYKHLMRCNKN